jgi:hypothetical protein
LTDDYLKIKGSDVSGNLIIDTNLVTNIMGTTGGINYTITEATATLSGASTTIQVNVPTGAKIIGCQLRVDTLVTSADGATSWTAAYSGGSTQAIIATQAFTKSTKVNKWFSNANTDIAASETDIAITPNSNTFSGGEIRAIVYYQSFVTQADAP